MQTLHRKIYSRARSMFFFVSQVIILFFPIPHILPKLPAMIQFFSLRFFLPHNYNWKIFEQTYLHPLPKHAWHFLRTSNVWLWDHLPLPANYGDFFVNCKSKSLLLLDINSRSQSFFSYRIHSLNQWKLNTTTTTAPISFLYCKKLSSPLSKFGSILFIYCHQSLKKRMYDKSWSFFNELIRLER